MTTINVSVNVDESVKRLGFVRKQIPFITSLAINRTGQKVKAKEEHEIKDVFDRATLYIQKSIFLKSSNKTNLTAIVGIKDFASKSVPATKILDAEIKGGSRRLKRYEIALRRVGALPNGYYTVPGKAAPMNQYGNVVKRKFNEILSYFKAFPEDGYKANATEATKAKLMRGSRKKPGVSYFVGRPADGKLPLGIWRRNHTGLFAGPLKKIEPIFIFVPSVMYKPVFDFQFVAENTVKKEFNGEFERAYREVIADR